MTALSDHMSNGAVVMDAFSIITVISIIFTMYAIALFFNYDPRIKY